LSTNCHGKWNAEEKDWSEGETKNEKVDKHRPLFAQAIRKFIYQEIMNDDVDGSFLGWDTTIQRRHNPDAQAATTESKLMLLMLMQQYLVAMFKSVHHEQEDRPSKEQVVPIVGYRNCSLFQR
jgi:hypothetical protein